MSQPYSSTGAGSPLHERIAAEIERYFSPLSLSLSSRSIISVLLLFISLFIPSSSPSLCPFLSPSDVRGKQPKTETISSFFLLLLFSSLFSLLVSYMPSAGKISLQGFSSLCEAKRNEQRWRISRPHSITDPFPFSPSFSLSFSRVFSARHTHTHTHAGTLSPTPLLFTLFSSLPHTLL
jgi:hypothetical protein